MGQEEGTHHVGACGLSVEPFLGDLAPLHSTVGRVLYANMSTRTSSSGESRGRMAYQVREVCSSRALVPVTRLAFRADHRCTYQGQTRSDRTAEGESARRNALARTQGQRTYVEQRLESSKRQRQNLCQGQDGLVPELTVRRHPRGSFCTRIVFMSCAGTTSQKTKMGRAMACLDPRRRR